MITPSNLQTGDTIGLITPSSPMQSDRLECAIQYFEQKACAIPFLSGAGQASPRPLAEIFFD